MTINTIGDERHEETEIDSAAIVLLRNPVLTETDFIQLLKNTKPSPMGRKRTAYVSHCASLIKGRPVWHVMAAIQKNHMHRYKPRNLWMRFEIDHVTKLLDSEIMPFGYSLSPIVYFDSMYRMHCYRSMTVSEIDLYNGFHGTAFEFTIDQ